MIRNYVIAILAVAVIILGGILWYDCSRSGKKEDIQVSPARIHDVTSLAELCAMEIYSENPMVDTIDNKVMVAVLKLRGSISFDMEKMEVEASGDTIRATLPTERITLLESTDPGSWQVIDSKAIGPLAMLRSGKVTLEEENALKARMRRKAEARLYANGTVARARREAVLTLQTALSSIYRRPAIVNDPAPQGSR
ncbi:MAG: DUF4230 domain-containing protein [Muribaculaceae bacterium]|nr:DUF4230 domain-containing protein [Muribaculaceae bacterium]